MQAAVLSCLVITGLDPVIYSLPWVQQDCRIKPGNDVTGFRVLVGKMMKNDESEKRKPPCFV